MPFGPLLKIRRRMRTPKRVRNDYVYCASVNHTGKHTHRRHTQTHARYAASGWGAQAGMCMICGARYKLRNK